MFTNSSKSFIKYSYFHFYQNLYNYKYLNLQQILFFFSFLLFNDSLFSLHYRITGNTRSHDSSDILEFEVLIED